MSKKDLKDQKKKSSVVIRKWSRIIHRDLSYFFSGIILVYAISGIVLNHKKDFNAEYSIKQYIFNIEGNYPLKAADFDKQRVKNELLEPYGEAKNYTKHYFPDSLTMKEIGRASCRERV